jgi:ribonuclease T2
MVHLRKLLFLLLWCSAPGAPAQAQSGDFDHYVLALSWSPTFCLSEDGRRERRQCAGERVYAFVVHGLWPQHRRGWPSNCGNGEAPLPEQLVESMLDIMPSRRLVAHQWEKHGTCSGLEPGAYFGLIRSLFAGLRIPARYIAPQAPIERTPGQLVGDFVSSNRGLRPDMMSVHCGGRRGRARLTEVRICLSHGGTYRACGANEARQCLAEQIVLPPARARRR